MRPWILEISHEIRTKGSECKENVEYANLTDKLWDEKNIRMIVEAYMSSLSNEHASFFGRLDSVANGPFVVDKKLINMYNAKDRISWWNKWKPLSSRKAAKRSLNSSSNFHAIKKRSRQRRSRQRRSKFSRNSHRSSEAQMNSDVMAEDNRKTFP
ncbi:uncharacterized protein SAPINGB_P003674 [Magnusiomyces paraingens]|uniref:Uncharacterized protein n=1 Tax=Magnusiomyces paraingens TaxID=2606893 RepID=A0A5E8BVY8_9ASCO|nr:uncharacterized protein SAPINGB_P003674 [Saprochaete ingens]VVT53637.1 unnamed protein product [Saprochaete ingens]